MNFVLRVFFCGAIVCSLRVEAMETYDYNQMYRATFENSPVKSVSATSLSSGSITDETAVENAALSGDYVAQYLMAQKAGGEARSVYNDTRDSLLKKKAILLAISAIRGKYWKSLAEINSVMSSELDVSKYTDFGAVESLARSIYKDL